MPSSYKKTVCSIWVIRGAEIFLEQMEAGLNPVDASREADRIQYG